MTLVALFLIVFGMSRSDRPVIATVERQGVIPIAIPAQTSSCITAGTYTPIYGQTCDIEIRPPSGASGDTGVLSLVNDGSTACGSLTGQTIATLETEIVFGANTSCAVAPSDATNAQCPVYDEYGVGSCVWFRTGNVANVVVEGVQQRLASEGQPGPPDDCDSLYGDASFGASYVDDSEDQWWEALDVSSGDIHNETPANAILIRRACAAPRLLSIVLTDQFSASGSGPLLIRGFGDFFIAGCRDAIGNFNSRCVTSTCKLADGSACPNPKNEPTLSNTGQLLLEGMFVQIMSTPATSTPTYTATDTATPTPTTSLTATPSPTATRTPNAIDTVQVDSTADAPDADPGDGYCATSAGECSLRAAIQEANAASHPLTIVVPSGDYALAIAGADEDGAATGDLDLNAPLTIAGAGSDSVTVDGAGLDRAFEARAGVSLSGMTIRGGSNVALGGGINIVAGMATLSNVIIESNSAQTFGGAIANAGTAIIASSDVTHNAAGDGGGGIWNQGTLTITDTDVSDNTTTGFGEGGGVANYATGTFNATDSAIDANSSQAAGGGVYNEGAAHLTRTRVDGNISTSIGGGIFVNQDATSDVTLTDSTVSGNSVSAGGYGGGIYTNAAFRATGSTISGNSAGLGAGIFSDASPSFGQNMSVSNSTISGNDAGADGGGIYYRNAGTNTLNNVTVVLNAADSDNIGAGDGGGLASAQGSTPLQASNSIIANNTDGGGEAPDCYGTLQSAGHNLVLSALGCSIEGDTTGNIVGSDPNLGALTDNGGSTLTQALQLGSPAIDAGSRAAFGGVGACEQTDQRGIARPQGVACDIGAYELVQTYPTPTPTAMLTATPTGTSSGTPTDTAAATTVVPTPTLPASVGGFAEQPRLPIRSSASRVERPGSGPRWAWGAFALAVLVLATQLAVYSRRRFRARRGAAVEPRRHPSR